MKITKWMSPMFRNAMRLMPILFFYAFVSHADENPLIEELADTVAEIKVREYHIDNTPANDEKLSRTKISALKNRQQILKQELALAINADAEAFRKEKERELTRVVPIAEQREHLCKSSSNSRRCLDEGIYLVLLDRIIEITGESLFAERIPQNIQQSGVLDLTDSISLSYKTTYDVTFDNDGDISYMLNVRGEYNARPSAFTLEQLKIARMQALEKSLEQRVQALAAEGFTSMLRDEEMIEKRKRRNVIVGSF